MGRWWSSSATDRRITRAALAALLPFALVACGGRDGAGPTADVPAAVDDTPSGALPTPTAAPGTSVTGMPTRPPPPATASPPDADVATIEAPPAIADAPVDPSAPLPAPVDGAVAPEPGDAVAPGTAPPAALSADIAAATGTVTQYLAAVSSGALARGQGLWSTTPNDSAVLQLARGATFEVSVGTGVADAGGRVTVPVDVRGTAEDGTGRQLQAAYVVQRTPTGTWRIVTATVRDAAP